MDPRKTLQDMSKDLKSVSAPLDAHIQIQQIVKAYEDYFAAQEEAEQTDAETPEG